MYPTTPRDRLLDAAMRRLHAQGFNASGVQDITADAGIAKGSFYNHFESKEALGAAALEQYFRARTCERMAVLRDATLPPLTRLRRYFEGLAAMLAGNGYASGCMIGNMAAELADHSPLIRDQLAAHFAEWSRVIEAVIAEAQATGTLRADLPAPVVASFLLNAWEGAILRARVTRDDVPFREFLTVVFATLTAERNQPGSAP
jgi:TetR/AcrR family transcriptional regulator, transcriptional repressor for nem operon